MTTKAYLEPLEPKEYLEPAETLSIEDQAKCLRDQVLIRLLRRLGCRISEVLGIEVSHISFSQRQIRIEHEKIRISLSCPYCAANGEKTRLSKKHSFCPRCGRSVTEAVTKASAEKHLRKIPVDEDTLQLVRTYIKGGWVTTDIDGKQRLFTITRQYAWRIVKGCAERAGFMELENSTTERKHHVGPHKFRDAFATNAMKNRPSMDDARLLQELLGHQKIDTTLRYRKVQITELHNFYDSLISEEHAGPKPAPSKLALHKLPTTLRSGY